MDDTHNVVRLAAGVFALTTSLVLGLLLNSAKNTFESTDRNVHAFATELILMDRTLRQYGPETADARQRLAAYVRQALASTWPAKGPTHIDDSTAEQLLDAFGVSVRAIVPDAAREELWHDLQQDLHEVVKQRWALVEETEGTLPAPLIALLAAPAHPDLRELWLQGVSAMLSSWGLSCCRPCSSRRPFTSPWTWTPFDGPIHISSELLQRVIMSCRDEHCTPDLAGSRRLHPSPSIGSACRIDR